MTVSALIHRSQDCKFELDDAEQCSLASCNLFMHMATGCDPGREICIHENNVWVFAHICSFNPWSCSVFKDTPFQMDTIPCVEISISI